MLELDPEIQGLIAVVVTGLVAGLVEWARKEWVR